MFRSHSLPSPHPSFQSVYALPSPGSISKRSPKALRSRLKRGEMDYIGPIRLDFDRPSPSKPFGIDATASTPSTGKKRRSTSLPLNEALEHQQPTWPPGFKPDHVERDFRIALVYPPHSHKFKKTTFSNSTNGVVCHVCLTKNIKFGRKCTHPDCPRVLCDDCVNEKFEQPQFGKEDISADSSGTIIPPSSAQTRPEKEILTQPLENNAKPPRHPHPPQPSSPSAQPYCSTVTATSLHHRSRPKSFSRFRFPQDTPSFSSPPSASSIHASTFPPSNGRVHSATSGALAPLLKGLNPVEVLALRLRLQQRQNSTHSSSKPDAFLSSLTPTKSLPVADAEDQSELSPIGFNKPTVISPKDSLTKRLHALTASDSPSSVNDTISPAKRKRFQSK